MMLQEDRLQISWNTMKNKIFLDKQSFYSFVKTSWVLTECENTPRLFLVELLTQSKLVHNTIAYWILIHHL